ncbi:hypothetical protein, partial [Shewanella mangrovisoli]|uniref:hypothetical protein n=1 Tax=Shewanella mangrovisoli TaxID=2864211 RepID=UPI0035BAE21C
VRVGHRQAPNILDKRAESQLNKLAFLFLQFLTATFNAVLNSCSRSCFINLSALTDRPQFAAILG